MFERFTRSARDAVVRAQEESAALGHDHIGTEHLLLGLAAGGGPVVEQILSSVGVGDGALRAAVRDGGLPDGMDADALASIGIDLDAVRRSVEESFGPGALSGRPRGGSRTGHKPFSAGAKRVFERSLREAVARRGRELRPEHLLLGLVGERDGGAAAALRRCGTSPDAVRAATLRALRDAA
jgi:ATP-dependent Clp protease ATP-binding subunit ClpA